MIDNPAPSSRRRGWRWSRLRLVLTAILASVLVGVVMVPGRAFAATVPPPSLDECQGFQNGPNTTEFCGQEPDGHLEYFWIGTSTSIVRTLDYSGALYHMWTRANGTWSGPSSLGGVITEGMSGCVNVDGRVEIFVRAAGGDVDHIWQKAKNGVGGWSAWSSLGGVLSAGTGPTCQYITNMIGPDWKTGSIKVRVWTATSPSVIDERHQGSHGWSPWRLDYSQTPSHSYQGVPS